MTRTPSGECRHDHRRPNDRNSGRLTFVSIPTLGLYGHVHEANYIAGTGPETPVVVGGVLEVIVALAGIGTRVLEAAATIPAVNAVLLGSLLYRSRLVPRALPPRGLAGGAPACHVRRRHPVRALGRLSPVTAIATIPIAVWEFSLGVYLIVKGFRPSPVAVV